MIPASFGDELAKIAAFSIGSLINKFRRAPSAPLPADLSNRLARVQRAGAAAVDRSKVNLANLQTQYSPARQQAMKQLAEMKRQRGVL